MWGSLRLVLHGSRVSTRAEGRQVIRLGFTRSRPRLWHTDALARCGRLLTVAEDPRGGSSAHDERAGEVIAHGGHGERRPERADDANTVAAMAITTTKSHAAAAALGHGERSARPYERVGSSGSSASVSRRGSAGTRTRA
jgi:hypothetical protein